MKKKFLFLSTEDWYFASHRLSLAIKAKELGYEVYLICNFDKHESYFKNLGINTINWKLNRKSNNIFIEISKINTLRRLIQSIKPNLIHSIAIKPVLYLSIIKLFQGNIKTIYSFGGLGFIFSSKKLYAKLIRIIISGILAFTFSKKDSLLILQNNDDKDLILKLKIIHESKIRLVPGSGVDTEYYLPSLLPEKLKPIVILPARMLWDKGVEDFVKCSDIVNKIIPCRFILVGGQDEHNPENIDTNIINNWCENKNIEWWGHQNDMSVIYKQSSIICFPSFREGFPKALLEAASSARPIVAYNVPGCKEIVIDGYNGRLIEFRNINKLSEAIISLLKNKSLCESYGKNGRQLVLDNFRNDLIETQIVNIWNEILSK